MFFKKRIKYDKEKILDKFQKDNTLVTFEELLSLPLGTKLEIVPDRPGSIQTERLESTNDNKIIFKVIMLKGEHWSKHKHDCDEVIAMRRGVIRDDITHKKLSKGGFLFIPEFTPHTIEALEDSEFYVEFQKDL